MWRFCAATRATLCCCLGVKCSFCVFVCCTFLTFGGLSQHGAQQVQHTAVFFLIARTARDPYCLSGNMPLHASGPGHYAGHAGITKAAVPVFMSRQA